MKKLILVILITIPFIGFSQDLSKTVWYIIEDNKDRQIINFHEDGTFTYIMVRSEFGNEGMSWGDENETWEVIGDLVRISYNDGFMIKMGKINGEYMEGSLLSKLEDRGQGTWYGRKLE